MRKELEHLIRELQAAADGLDKHGTSDFNKGYALACRSAARNITSILEVDKAWSTKQRYYPSMGDIVKD